MRGFIFSSMVFMHIVDDYYLQGILANLKQRSYWESHAPDKMYKYDYIVALLMHGISWSFCIMLPIVISNGLIWNTDMTMFFIFNALVHSVVDNAKANQRKINLIVDQSIHMVQVLITFLALYAK